MPATIYTHPIFFKHETPEGHPECPARYETLTKTLQHYDQVTPKDRNIDKLILKAHSANHVALLEESLIEDEITCIDGSDTFLSNHSLDAAKQAINNICQAIDDTKAENTNHSFCISRPPGHHAEPNKAMGFCLFNTIFIGALYARESGYERIAILDFDVHHGNGTEAMMKKHSPENMIFLSSHQYPLFTVTGQYSDTPIYNYPLPSGSGSSDMRTLYKNQILPEIEQFNPDLLLISAGFDAHENDPYAGLNWQTEDYSWLGEQLKHYKTVSTLEGGYNLPALKESVFAYINSLEK